MRVMLKIITAFLLICSSLNAWAAKDVNIVDIAQLISDEEYSKAKPLLKKYLVQNPEDDMAWYYYSYCYWAEQDYAAAVNCMERAKELDPSNSEYYELLFSACDALYPGSKLSDSLALEMMEKFPNKYNTPYFLTVLAESELNNHKDSLALEHLNAAFEKDPLFLQAELLLLEYYLNKSEFASVFNLLPYVVMNQDVDVEVKAQIIMEVIKSLRGSEVRIFSKRIDEICDLFMAMHPKDLPPYMMAASWAQAKDDKEEAEKIYRQMAKNLPPSFMPWVAIESLYMDDFEKREQILMEGLAHVTEKQDIASIYVSLANLYFYGNDKKQGLHYYEKAYKLCPDNALILNNFAYALSMERKDLKKAKKLAKKALELEPENASYLDTYGYILYLRGEYEEAKKYYKKALVYGGKEHKELLEHYALTLEALGESDLAEYYRNLAKDK